jgi:hypothetical protein
MASSKLTIAAKHSSATSEWFTPEPILERVRAVLGVIDLDPASSAEANERVMARRWIGAEEHGLYPATDWAPNGPVSVFINPPGGTSGGRSLAGRFWAKLVDECYGSRITHAVFLAFNGELIQTSQRGDSSDSIANYPLCAPSKRIRFLAPDGTPGPSPTHSSLIVYVPGLVNRTGAFLDAFRSLGSLLVPAP